MTAADWSVLIPAIVACLGALAAWLRAEAAHRKATDAQAKITAITGGK